VGGSLVDNTAQQVSKTTTNRQRQDLPSSGHHRRHQKQQQQHQQHHPLALPLATALSMLITAPNASEDADNSSSAACFVTPLNHVTTRAGQAATTCIVTTGCRGSEVDLHVLSSGQVTFCLTLASVCRTKDSWTLTIRYTQPRDAGSYSCQVNTQPLIASWYNLTVVGSSLLHTFGSSVASMALPYWRLSSDCSYRTGFSRRRGPTSWGRDHDVQSGSTVTLECVIKEGLLSQTETRGEGGVTQVANVSHQHLTVTTAAQQDSGCFPAGPRQDDPTVSSGRQPLQHSSSAAWVSTLLLVPATLTSLLFLLT
ncbi:hypothetical protein Hamer_G031086, partial [Homarus americanus]